MGVHSATPDSTWHRVSCSTGFSATTNRREHVNEAEQNSLMYVYLLAVICTLSIAVIFICAITTICNNHHIYEHTIHTHTHMHTPTHLHIYFLTHLLSYCRMPEYIYVQSLLLLVFFTIHVHNCLLLLYVVT